MQEPIINEREQQHAQELKKAGVPIPAEWFDNDSFLTLFYNASSAAIPVAERFVVSAVEEIAPEISDPSLRKRAENIIHEENAHSRVHEAYNTYLRAKGFPIEKYEKQFKRVIAFVETHCSLQTKLAICAISEHFTACIGKQVLDSGRFESEGVDERMDRVWTWHALEELDHRSTAFDLYNASGGKYPRRVIAALAGTLLFMVVHNACLLSFLRHEKRLRHWQTWKVGIPFLFGRRGIYTGFIRDWLRYFRPGFHPLQLPIKNTLQKQLHHYHIESELISYFATNNA